MNIRLTERESDNTFLCMAKRESRITEKREYFGQTQVEALINWLNLTIDVEGRQRIINIIGLFILFRNQKARMTSSYFERDGNWYEHETPDSIKRDELEDALEKALSFYKMTPRIYIAGPDGKPRDWDVFVWWNPIPGSALSRCMKKIGKRQLESLSKEDRDKPGAQMAESGALKNLLELVESRFVWKIGACRCGKFFFRKFQHQRFCSEKCRIAEFRNSDEARQKRNEYARKLYHLHKSGKVK
jgi:hypothetical protein